MESGAFYPVFSGHSTMLPHTPEPTNLRYTTFCHTPQDSAPPSVFKGSRALLHLTLWGFLLWFGLMYAFIGCNGSSLQHAGSVAVMPCSMRDLTSPTKDQTCVPCIGRQDLNNWHQGSLCCYSVAQSYLTLCDPMDCSMPGLPVRHHLLESAQTHVH